jgi:hypothetical protein
MVILIRANASGHLPLFSKNIVTLRKFLPVLFQVRSVNGILPICAEKKEQ